MNASEPSDSGWLSSSGKVGSFAYGIGVSVGVLILITTITLASYYCTRNHLYASPTTTPRTRRRRQANEELTPATGPTNHTVVEIAGLDEETIKSYPNLPYDEARVSYSRKNDSGTTSCCSICLADYKGSDTIRVLPGCNHLFHDKCVDPWLRLHPSCPVCRTSPLPTPVGTPLLEVIPLAGQARD